MPTRRSRRPPHRLQPAVAAALDRLAGLVATARGFAGLLTAVSGYDPVRAR